MPSQPVSLFPRYSSKENRTTNYTLLVLRLLYEESPKLYQGFLDVLLGESAPETLPVFTQQVKTPHGVPDGVIEQQSYKVYVETKTGEWFTDDQLDRHLDALKATTGDRKFLLALSPFEHGGARALAAAFEHKALGARVTFAARSFRDVLDALPRVETGSHLGRVVEEFESYLASANLLGSWQTQLDVVNVATWPEHVSRHRVYTCPATGAGYAHRPCRFISAYHHKVVSHVAEIRGVVRLATDGTAELQWSDESRPAEALVASARERSAHAWGEPRDYDLLAFVLDTPVPTHFEKDSSGGMRGSRQYFDLSKLPPGSCDSATSLARALNGLRWSDVA